MKRANWILGCGVLIASACGGGNNSKPDAKVISDTGSPATMDIHGTGTGHFITDTGVVDTKRDFSMATVITSVTPNGTAFDHHSGTGASDGTFTVPVNMGAATWDLGVTFGTMGTPIYLVGNSTAPDLSFYNFGRGDAALPAAATSVTMSVTGMAAWAAKDDLEVMSSNAGSLYFSPQLSFATKPAAGNTTITSQTFAWSDQLAPLVESAKGDITVVFQLSTKTSGADQYAAISKLGTVAGFTQTSGQTATMAVALTDVAQNKTLTVHWKRSQFEALKAQMGPGAVGFTGSALLAIDAQPQATAHGFTGFAAPDLTEFLPTGTTDLDETFTYGNPFSTMGTAWDEFMIARYDFHVPVLAAGASAPFQLQVGIDVNIPVAQLAATGNITPPITPVTGVMVGGMDASAPRTGVGATPIISWTAPATGTASGYIVDIYLVSNNSGTTALRSVGAFYLASTTTSLQVPDTVLASGASYVAVIQAVGTSGANLTTTPFLTSLPDPFATMATAQFKP